MRKMGFMDDMNWYRNMNTGLDAIMKVNRTLSLHENINGGLAAAMAKMHASYDEPYRTLRSISESYNSYNKIQNTLEKALRLNTGLAFDQPKYKNLLVDVMQKQTGMLSAVNAATKPYKTLSDMVSGINMGIHHPKGLMEGLKNSISQPKPYLTLMDAMHRINTAVPGSLFIDVHRFFSKQDSLFAQLRKQPCEINYYTFTQAATLSLHAGLVSKRFITDVLTHEDWEELEESGDVIDSITSLVTDFISRRLNWSEFYVATAEVLNAFTGFPTTENARIIRERFTWYITIVLAIFSLKAEFMPKEDKSLAAIQRLEHEVRLLRTDSAQRLNQLSPAAFQQRIACRNTAIYFKPMSKSKVLAKVKAGQIIRVIETYHKWVYITFADEKKKEIHSGYVMKKYFEEF